MPRHINRPYDDWLTDNGSGYCPRCDTCFVGKSHNCEEVAEALKAQDQRKSEADLYDAMLEANEKLSQALKDFSDVCDQIKKRFT